MSWAMMGQIVALVSAVVSFLNDSYPNRKQEDASYST
jgi:hypothetical protein